MGAKFDKLKEQYDDLKEFTYSVIAKRDEYYHLLGNIYVASTELKGVPLSDLPVAVAAKFKRDRDRINQLENEKGDLLGELEERDKEIAELNKQHVKSKNAESTLEGLREFLNDLNDLEQNGIKVKDWFEPDGNEGEAADDGFEDDEVEEDKLKSKTLTTDEFNKWWRDKISQPQPVTPYPARIPQHPQIERVSRAIWVTYPSTTPNTIS